MCQIFSYYLTIEPHFEALAAISFYSELMLHSMLNCVESTPAKYSSLSPLACSWNSSQLKTYSHYLLKSLLTDTLVFVSEGQKTSCLLALCPIGSSTLLLFGCCF